IEAAELDQMPAARRFVSETCMYVECGAERLRLRYWRGEFWVWSESAGRYARISNDVVRAKLTFHLDAYARRITNAVKANVIDHVKALTIVMDSVEMPGWIDGAGAFPANEILATKSGLMHLPTFADGGSDFLLPGTPRFFSGNVLDYPFDAAAPEPSEWLKYLSQLWPNDQQSID